MFGLDMQKYLTIGLSIVIMILLGSIAYMTISYEAKIAITNKKISKLKEDISEHEKLELKLDKKIDDQKKAIKAQKATEDENLKTISRLQSDLNASKKITKTIYNNHSKEVSKLKKLITSLREEAEVTGDLHIKDCIIQLEEINNEKDFIGNSINSVGF